MNAVEGRRRTISRRTMLKMGLLLGEAVLLDICTSTSKKKAPEYKSYPGSRELPPFPEFQAPDRDQRAVTILLKNKGDKEPFSPEEFEMTLNKAKAFYDRISYGKIQYSFTSSTSWQTVEQLIPREKPDSVANVGDSLLKEKLGTSLKLYQTRLYIVPANDFNIIEGYGQAGNLKRVWIYGYNGGKTPPASMRAPLDSVLEHELGHTLGLVHEGDLFPNIDDDYTHDVRNLGIASMNFDVAERVALGWVGRSQIQDVTKSGIYTVSQVDTKDSKAQLGLRIQKGDTNQRYYAFFNKPYGIMSARHLSFYLWDEKKNSGAGSIAPTDHPGGQYFIDKINGITIKELGNEGNNLTVGVTLNE